MVRLWSAPKGPGCWLCKGKDTRACPCCKYKAQRPEAKTPEFIQDMYSRESTLPVSDRLAHTLYLDVASFGAKKDQPVVPPPRTKRQLGFSFDAAPRKRRRADATRANQHRTGADEPDPCPVGVVRLRRFMQTLEILRGREGKDVYFDENERIVKMYTATLLPQIVGAAEFTKHSPLLYKIIGVEDYSHIGFLVWITSRQSGKTTVLARIIAALILTAIRSTIDFIGIYSTTQARTSAVLDEAKEYVRYVETSTVAQSRFEQIGMVHPIVIEKDNMFVFRVSSMAVSNVMTTTVARPSKADSCRGDAFDIAVGDEFCFLEAKMWNKFLKPLFAVTDRVLMLASTPADPEKHAHAFIEEQQENNKRGEHKFHVVNHSLMCDHCFENKRLHCSHRLYLLPPWKGHYNIRSLLKSVPKGGEDAFMAEFYGRPYCDTSAYFPRRIVQLCLNQLPTSARNIELPSDPLITIAVDPPAAHGMGLFATVRDTTGRTIIIGADEVDMNRTEPKQVEMCVSNFTQKVLSLELFRRIRASAHVRSIRVLPAVECNNNAILSKSVVNAISQTAQTLRCKVLMPFTKDVWGKDVSDGIGMVTTENTKMRAIL